MGVFSSIFKVTFKTFADVPSWINYNGLKSYSKFLWQGIKPAFRISKKQVTVSSFNEVVKQNSLTEEDLKKRAQYFLIYFFIYILSLILCIAYSFYLFFNQYLMAGIIATLISLAFFFQALSMHFFYFEIKHKKLGCTFKEWLSGNVNDAAM